MQPVPYAIPPGNPFVDVGAHPNDCAEIFNWGFRNPFRFSIDRETGDMLIGDVGQNTYEEIDFQPAGSAGQNFQWNAMRRFPRRIPAAARRAGAVRQRCRRSSSTRIDSAAQSSAASAIAARSRRFAGQYVFSDDCSGGIYVVANADGNVAVDVRDARRNARHEHL